MKDFVLSVHVKAIPVDSKGIMRDTVGNSVYITTEDMTDNMIEMFMLLAEKKFIEKNKEERD
mgnify:FL=1|tara:strand:- start:1703 stop:1888 length:186 start_codon:yes stop_codon:yes gene_type:complete